LWESGREISAPADLWQEPDVPYISIGFGGAIPRDPPTESPRRCSLTFKQRLSGQVPADNLGPAIGDFEILLARVDQLV
jgi:hypothetical protein